jgi:uncharacterized protein YbcI
MDSPDHQQTLASISQRLGTIVGRHLGRAPARVDAYAVDDMLFVVMRGGGLTPHERTLSERGRSDRVLELRRDFQRMIAGRHRVAVEELTGHRVIRSLSQVHVEPELMIEIFFIGEQDGADDARPD